ncbi:hypothetical protein FHU41_000108 [Psychromicrobium silvestre]|uniref:MarR family transcriptional regulator n=1 Tax=Psychromicrobium silvestre TaxID=1645614 RepID=A0A7Y9LQS8_9MICC|nr:hypothetical protein [Psychromicrobium silvestre]NYE93887.1 hypothetical protein [Psychromicrobium silvestre]
MDNEKPMQPAIRQPLGFWTARAGEAIRNRTRGALAGLGVSQPEWWVLHQLSQHPEGIERAAMVEVVGPNESLEAIEIAIASSASKGWLVESGELLVPTEAGFEIFARAAGLQAELQAERMHGISEEDFVTTITVLQRTIKNVGGQAWHW